MNATALTCFQFSITDQVAHLVLSRPEAMNTMGPAFWRELDELLAAHPQYSSAPNLQMPASFLRNASFATATRH